MGRKRRRGRTYQQELVEIDTENDAGAAELAPDPDLHAGDLASRSSRWRLRLQGVATVNWAVPVGDSKRRRRGKGKRWKERAWRKGLSFSLFKKPTARCRVFLYNPCKFNLIF
jgi:hypothetical protein